MIQRVLAAARGVNNHRAGGTAVGTLCCGFAVACAGGVVVRFASRAQVYRLKCAVFAQVVRQVSAELLLGLREQNAILGTLRTGDGGHHRGKVQLKVLGVRRLRGVLIQPHALSLGVSFNQCNLLFRSTGQAHVLGGLLVDGEHGTRRAELRRHVANGGAVGQRHSLHTRAIEFHKLLDHAVLAQHFCNGQHHIGGSNTGWDFTSQFEANNAGDQHGHRLTQHSGLCLNATHAPAENTQTVFHGGVGVGTNARIRVGEAIIVKHHAGEVFNIHLVHNAGSGRHHAEVGKRLGSPPQELITLFIAFVFNVDVGGQSVRVAESLNDHRVVNHHLCGVQRVHLVGVTAKSFHRFTHGGKVNHTRDTSKVLHQHPGRGELDLNAWFCSGIPVGNSLNMLCGDVRAVLGA